MKLAALKTLTFPVIAANKVTHHARLDRARHGMDFNNKTAVNKANLPDANDNAWVCVFILITYHFHTRCLTSLESRLSVAVSSSFGFLNSRWPLW